MKNKTLFLTLLSITAFAAGCGKEQTTSQQMDKVQTETTQATQDMKDYTFAQKAEFVKTMQGQLDALNKDLDQLSAKIDSSSDAVKAEAKPKLQALRDQVTQLNQQLADAQNATESTWDSVKAGFQKAYEATKDGFQKTRQWMSDKITP
ncbi:MAG TPA: methyl-accepting chemotaxis protein [Verrucomicrobiae bacterium]|nr:methyl-accepting chemotaxis protein [Verrucomicrobiae bacterium]